MIATPAAFFEKIGVQRLMAIGYGDLAMARKVVGRSGDGGIDGVIEQDALRLERVYIQAKRYAVGDAVSELKFELLAEGVAPQRPTKLFCDDLLFPQPGVSFAERHHSECVH